MGGMVGVLLARCACDDGDEDFEEISEKHVPARSDQVGPHPAVHVPNDPKHLMPTISTPCLHDPRGLHVASQHISLHDRTHDGHVGSRLEQHVRGDPVHWGVLSPLAAEFVPRDPGSLKPDAYQPPIDISVLREEGIGGAFYHQAGPANQATLDPLRQFVGERPAVQDPGQVPH